MSEEKSKTITTVGDLCSALVGGGDDEFIFVEDEFFAAGAKMRTLRVQLKGLLLRDLHDDKRPEKTPDTPSAIENILAELVQGKTSSADDWIVLGGDTRLIARETAAAMDEFKAQIRAALQGPSYKTMAESQAAVGDRPIVVHRIKLSDFGLKD